MKAYKAVALAGALLSLGAVASLADQTNVVQNLNVRLFGLRQGGPETNGSIVLTPVELVRLDTRRVIEALGAATANSFSSTSRLAVVTPLGGGPAAIQVRDGNKTPVDVTAFFDHQQLSDSVASSLVNRRIGRTTSTIYDLQRFALHDVEGYPALNAHFDVSGLTTESATSQWPGVNNLDAEVTGTGDRNGRYLILQGSLELDNRRLEVVPGGGGGGPNV